MGTLANGHLGLCEFSSPPCTIAPGEPLDFTILNNHCDRWPYGDDE